MHYDVVLKDITYTQHATALCYITCIHVNGISKCNCTKVIAGKLSVALQHFPHYCPVQTLHCNPSLVLELPRVLLKSQKLDVSA